MKNKTRIATTALSMLFAVSAQAAAFGDSEDVNYANTLWQQMQDAGYVGENAIMSVPYTGTHPHGAILDTIDTRLEVDGKENILIIKRNYGGEGVSKSAVANAPDKYLKAVTVMYKRKGLDAETKDWFWVKYGADGSILKNPKGMSLAGLVGKGAAKGCIACHQAAPGGDMVFNHDRYTQ